MIKSDQFQKCCHGIDKMPWLTLGLTTILAALYCLGPSLFEHFLFNKQAVSSGQIWRFITGHFVHCNFEHFFWDALAFVILGAVIETNRRSELIPVLILSCLTVSVWLFWGQTERMTYCGLSGALNGLLIAAVMLLWSKSKNNMYFIMIAATITKIIFEFTTHQTVFTSLASQAVPGAHLAGLLGGSIYVVLKKCDETHV